MKASVQELADALVAPEYRQPVKTLAEALNANGWQYVDRPICCGAEIEISSFIGSPYFAECKTCGKFIVDVTGPRFGNGHVNLPDDEKVNLGGYCTSQTQCGIPAVVEG